MINEFIFIVHSILIAIFGVYSLRISKEALTSLLCVQAILSNLFISKQIVIFGLCATCSDAFSVGAGLTLNLLQEYFGKKIAQKTIWISFFCLIFYLLMTQIHLIYLPSEFDTMHKIYSDIFALAPRFVIVSIISYLISQQIDLILYAYFREKFAGKFFLLRNYGSLIISQFIDTAFFTIFGLWGVMNNLGQIFVVSYSVKLITIFLGVFIVNIVKNYSYEQ